MTTDERVENRRLLPTVNRKNTLLAAVSALLYVVAVGMVAVYSSPATVDMKRAGSRFADVTDEQITWIASLPPLSGVLGNAVAGYMSQKLGRKAVLMYVSFSFTVSWLAIAYAPDMGFIYMGRLVSGFCAGICSVTVPAYVVEISTVDIRGLLTSGFQIAFTLGVFFMTSLGNFLRWSWLAVSGAVFVVSGACFIVWMPESPQWLVRKSRNDEAFRGLRFLRSRYSAAARELKEIVDHQRDESKDGLALKELADPGLYKPVLIAVALMFFQQTSGINALMSYSEELFQKTSSFIKPSVAVTIVALVQVLATCVSSLLMDKAGRRVLYMTSGLCIALSLATSGVFNYLTHKDDTTWNWVPLSSFVVYIAGFSLGFGPIPFVVTPEMVPTRSRSFLLAVASVSSSFFSFVVTKTFNDLRGAIGFSGVCWTYAVFAFLGFLFYWIFVPETKGKTIKDIHRSFSIEDNS